MDRFLGLLLLFLLSCQGCSVALSMTGKQDPNLSVIRTGASRGEIELQLGSPVSAIPEEGGCTRCLYEYTLGRSPSAGRAIAHGVMDVLTLGIWEVAGTPIEGLRGETRRVQVLYGPDNKARDIMAAAPEISPAPPAPAPTPQE